MKIALVFTSIGYGGSLMYWDRPLKALSGIHDMSLLILGGKIDGSPISVNGISALTIPIYKGEKTYSKYVHIFNPLYIYRKLNDGFDLVVINECTILSIVTILICGILRIKTLLLVESSHVGLVRRKISLLGRIMRSLSFRGAHRILTNNQSGYEFIRGYNISDNKIVMKTYLTSELICEATGFTRSKKMRILYVGQLIERKGIRNLLNQIERVDRHLLENIEFLILGGGAQRAELERFVDEFELDFIRFLGIVEYEEICNIYMSSDIMIIPTLHDYRSLVGFEGLSCGLAILHSIYDGAVKEVTEDGVNGFIYDPCNFSDFVQKFIQIMEPEKLASFKSASSQRARLFTFNRVANNLQKIFEDIL